ncbi:hypothetical protein B0H11DRAFT_1932969 [Mycena galericulata]|nr:hypothetical protein B0H11DRAFT_1932969 [Mycena galericulata]
MPMHINPLSGRYRFAKYSQNHPRYAPYTVTRTCQRDNEIRVHDPTPGELRAFAAEMVDARQQGIILGYSLSEHKLVQWFRPTQVSKNGSLRRLAASRFQSTPGIQMPLCPHAANGFRTTEETSMVCKRANSRWAFQCTIQGCPIIMEIAPITSSQVLLTDQDLEDYLNQPDYIDGDGQDTEDEEFDSMDTSITDENSLSSSSSMEEVADYLSGQSRTSSSSSLSSTLSSSSPPTSNSGWSPNRMRPRRSDGSLRPYYSPVVAEKRRNPEHSMIIEVQTGEANGTYEKKPEDHPAWGSSDNPHPILLPYHPNSSSRRIADMMQNMTSPYGQIIRHFMSTVGIPRISLFHLCYHQHRDRGLCTGSVDLPKIPSRHPPLENVPFLQFRTYPANVEHPSGGQDLLDCTVGRAFVKWHSREGIPQDVWAMITTAYVHCKDCDLLEIHDWPCESQQTMVTCRTYSIIGETARSLNSPLLESSKRDLSQCDLTRHTLALDHHLRTEGPSLLQRHALRGPEVRGTLQYQRCGVRLQPSRMNRQCGATVQYVVRAWLWAAKLLSGVWLQEECHDYKTREPRLCGEKLVVHVVGVSSTAVKCGSVRGALSAGWAVGNIQKVAHKSQRVNYPLMSRFLVPRLHICCCRRIHVVSRTVVLRWAMCKCLYVGEAYGAGIVVASSARRHSWSKKHCSTKPLA